MSGEPFPKSRQLARGERRYRRKVASSKQWQAIIAAKLGPCRVFVDVQTNGTYLGRITFHHVVFREDGGGDVADNIVPVSERGQALIHGRDPWACKRLLASLTDAEYAHMIEHGGESYPERAYGVTYGR